MRCPRMALSLGAALFLFASATPLWAQWTTLTPLSDGNAIGSPGGTHPIAASGNTLHFVWESGGNIHYRRSTDAGFTWTADATVVSNGSAAYPCSIEISGSTLHLFWIDLRSTATWELFYKRSTDGGTTWGADTRLTTNANFFRFGTAILGSSLHVAWGGSVNPAGSAAPSNLSRIGYIRSTDGGNTWGPIAQITSGATGNRPAIAANGSYVHVTWLDGRNSTQTPFFAPDPTWDSDIYTTRSTDGGTTWGSEVRMTNTPGVMNRHPQITATPGVVCCIWEYGQVFNGSVFVGSPSMYRSVSLDNGQTWSPRLQISAVNAPNGWATHSKSWAYGSVVHLSWTDSPYRLSDGSNDIRETFAMHSVDGGRTWTVPEQLTFQSDGQLWTNGVAGTDTYQVVLPGPLSSGISYRRRDFPTTAPTVAQPAGASPSTIAGTKTALSVLGADGAGEANLTYTWTASGPGPVSFNPNATNAAKNSTATFSAAGNYILTVTIRNASGGTTTSSVNVTVDQTLTKVVVSPASASVVQGGTEQFAASAKDQFGNAMSSQPTFSWFVSGGGTISGSGLFTAGPATGGPFTVTATGGGSSGTASVTVTAAPPVLTTIEITPPSATVAPSGTESFKATGRDQYGNQINPQPTFTWKVSGGGTMDAAGLFTAGTTDGGPFTVTASGGGLSGTASVTVGLAPAGGGGSQHGCGATGMEALFILMAFGAIRAGRASH